MDNVLSSTHNLRTVTFKFGIGGDRADVKVGLFGEYSDVVRGHLPQQVERGVVRLDWVDCYWDLALYAYMNVTDC